MRNPARWRPGKEPSAPVARWRRLPARLLAATLVALPIQAALHAAPAHAATTWQVNQATGIATTPCGTSPNPPCKTISLAIGQASSGDTINIAAGDYNETVTINNSLTLTGANPATTFIDGVTLTGPVVTVNATDTASAPLTASISGLTVENGTGSTIFGGGILNDGTLTLSNCAVTNNAVGGNTSIIALGGGIASSNSLTVTNCAITGNSATANGTGTFDGLGSIDLAAGGGIFAFGTLVVNGNSTVNTNTVSASNGNAGALFALGGGIATVGLAPLGGGSATIDSSAVSGNVATGSGRTASLFDIAGGGGIATIGGLTMTGSTISNNVATDTTQGLGGGIFSLDSLFGIGTLSIGTSTVSGNQALGAFFSAGGGVDDGMILANLDTFITPEAANTQALANAAKALGTTPAALSATEAALAPYTAHLGTLDQLRTDLRTMLSSVPGSPAAAVAARPNVPPAIPVDTITSSTISGNTAGATGATGTQSIVSMGGGLLNGMTMTLTSSTVSTNSANAAGTLNAGGLAFGGGVDNSTSPLVLLANIISSGSAANALMVNQSTINGNTATETVVAPLQATSASPADTVGAGAIGGGVFSGAVLLFPYFEFPNGPLTILNSTITANTVTAPASAGGGVGLLSVNTPPSDTISFSTINDNSALTGATAHAGNNIGDGSDALALREDIIALTGANAGGTNCSFINAGLVTDDGYNLEYQNGTTLTTPTDCGLTAVTDVLNANPMLGPLALNLAPVGTPLTEALLPGSPAINAGGPGPCTDALGNTVATDERGAPLFVRPDPASNLCDIGAFEVQRVPSQTVVTLAPGSSNPANIGQSVTFIATVSPLPPYTGTPTGTVTFYDNSTGNPPIPGCVNVPLVTVSGQQQADCTTSFTAAQVGSNTIIAVYSGDVNFLPSQGTYIEVVGGCSVYTALRAAPGSPYPTRNLGALVKDDNPATPFPVHYITFTSGGGVGTFTVRSPVVTLCVAPGTPNASATIVGMVSSTSTPSVFHGGDTVSVTVSLVAGLPGPATVTDTTTGGVYPLAPPYVFGSFLHITTP